MRLCTVFFLFPANCSTCFGWYLRSSSGAHVNCNYSIWHWSNHITPFCCREGVRTDSSKTAESGNMVRSVPDAVIAVYVCSWWWVKVSPETCTAVWRWGTVYSPILLDNYWHCCKTVSNTIVNAVLSAFPIKQHLTTIIRELPFVLC